MTSDPMKVMFRAPLFVIAGTVLSPIATGLTLSTSSADASIFLVATDYHGDTYIYDTGYSQSTFDPHQDYTFFPGANLLFSQFESAATASGSGIYYEVISAVNSPTSSQSMWLGTSAPLGNFETSIPALQGQTNEVNTFATNANSASANADSLSGTSSGNAFLWSPDGGAAIQLFEQVTYLGNPGSFPQETGKAEELTAFSASNLTPSIMGKWFFENGALTYTPTVAYPPTVAPLPAAAWLLLSGLGSLGGLGWRLNRPQPSKSLARLPVR